MNADELREKAQRAFYDADSHVPIKERLDAVIATVIEACADELHDSLAYTDTDKQADEFLLGRIRAPAPRGPKP